MKKNLLIVILCGLSVFWSYAQTTVNTNHPNNNGNGSVIFNVQNTNAFDIIITDINCHLGSTATNNVQLLYRTIPFNDPAAPWDGGVVGAGQNGWILAGSGSVLNSNTANGIVTALSSLSLTVPAGLTYQLGFSATTMQYSSLSAGVFTFSGGGVNVITGDGISWGGTVYPSTPGNYPRGIIGGITFIPAVPCTSPPTAGSATAANATICPSTNNTISLTGGSGGTGQTYQWQSSADGVTFGNILGATNSIYIASQTAATYYRCVVTCSSLSDTSAVTFVGLNSFMDCYCTSIPTSAIDEEIYNVTINGGSTNPLYANTNGCSTVAPGPGSILGRYSNFKTLSPITTVAPGQTVSFSIVQDECDGPTYYNNGVAMWIDFNQNGLFTDPGEQVFVENTTTAGPRTINGSFVVPAGAIPGNTVVRIICAESYSGAGLTPCLAYGYGETEDHLITVACPDLTGATVLDAGACSGNAITLTGTPSSTISTITWWDAPSGGNQIGTGASFTSSPLFADTNFYVQEDFTGCPSSVRDQVSVIITQVDVTLAPQNVSCNNGNDGTFAISNIACGVAPFSFSVDGGSFGIAPTNLTVGTHTVIVQDGASNQSAPYVITIGNATAPSAIVVNTFNNDIVNLSWTAGGSETSWNVEWGTPGFAPGTGAELGSANALTNVNYVVSGLDGNTAYQFYISANCGVGTTPGTWISTNVTTLCDPLVAQGFCENFASDSPTEACWTVINANGDADAWNMNYTFNTFSGNQVAILNTDFNNGNNNDYLITPGMMLTGNEILSFHYRVQSSFEPNDFQVLLSTTGTNPADFTDTLMALNSYGNIVYQDTAINLSAFSGTCYIAFHVPPGGLDGWILYIDQVCVDICTPAPGIDGTVNVCRLDATLDLNTVITQGENNGVWQFAPNQGAVSGSDLNITAIPNGQFTAQYIVTTACTVDTTVATFNVFPASSAGVNGQLNVCRNQPIDLIAGLSGLVDHGGTWYNPSGVALTSGSLSSGDLPGQFNYIYVTSNGVCPNDTATVIVNVATNCDWTGIEELNADAITVYPNPSTGLFYISNSDATQNFSYEVLDLNGRIIVGSTTEVNGKATVEVNLTNVEHGIYMIKVSNESGSKLVRVVKN